MMPRFRQCIEEAENINELWVDVECELQNPYADPVSEEQISSLFKYAGWCLDELGEEEKTAVLVSFYEQVPLNRRLRRELPRHMSVEDFLGLKEIFRYMLSEEEYRRFVEEFLSEARRLRELRGSGGGEG